MAREKRTVLKRVSPLSVVVDDRDRGLVRRAAYLSELTVSAFVRDAAVKAAQRVIDRVDKAAA